MILHVEHPYLNLQWTSGQFKGAGRRRHHPCILLPCWPGPGCYSPQPMLYPSIDSPLATIPLDPLPYSLMTILVCSSSGGQVTTMLVGSRVLEVRLVRLTFLCCSPSAPSNPNQATPPTSGPAIIPGTSNFQAVRFNTISVNPPDPSAPKNPQTGGPWQYYPMESYDPRKTTRRYSKKSVKETGTANPVSGETQRPVDPPLMIARRQNPQANRMSGNTVPKRPSPASSSNSITTGNYPTWLNTGDLKRPPANPPSLIAPPPDLSNFVSMTNPGDQSKSRSRNFHPYPVPETQRPAVKPSSMQPGPSTGPKSGSRPTRGQRLDMLLQQAALSTESSNSDSGKPPGSKSRKFRG